MDSCKYLDEKRNHQASFEDEISKMDQVIMSSIKSAKGRNINSLNKKSSDPKEEFPDREGGIGNKLNRGGALELQRSVSTGSGRFQKTGVSSSVSSGPERHLHKAKSTTERRADHGAEINKKLKRFYSTEADLVKKQQLQQTTVNRHLGGNSGRLEKKEDRSSILFAPESDIKSKTKVPIHNAGITEKLERLFDPEPEMTYKDKGGVFQPSFEDEISKMDQVIMSSIESAEGRNIKTSSKRLNKKSSDPKGKFPNRDGGIGIKLNRGGAVELKRSVSTGSGRLQKTGVRSSVSSGPERPLHKAKSTSERRADHDAEINKKLKRLFSPEPEKDFKADLVKEQQLQQTEVNKHLGDDSGRLKKKEDRSSITFAPESIGKFKTKVPIHDARITEKLERLFGPEPEMKYKDKGGVFQQSKERIKGSCRLYRAAARKPERDAEIHQKLKRLFSPEPDNDGRSKTIKTPDGSDHDAQLKEKLSRILSPEPGKHRKADTEKGREFQTGNRNREEGSCRFPRVMRGHRKKLRFCGIGDTWKLHSVPQKRMLTEVKSDEEPPKKVQRIQ